MKFHELMNVYNFTSPMYITMNGKVIYDESDKYFCGSPIYDIEDLEQKEWYQTAKNYDVIGFAPSVDRDTGSSVLSIILRESLVDEK